MNNIHLSEFLHLGEFVNKLYSVYENYNDKRIEYYCLNAKNVDADYIFCINSELDNKNFPFLYIYDERGKAFENTKSLSKINKQIWTVGEIPFAVIVYDYEIKILDTRKPIDNEEKPNILDVIPLSEIEFKLKQKIFEGRILEETDSDYLSVSPYQMLLQHIENKILRNQKSIRCSEHILKKLLIRFILIRYLEEQIDDTNGSVFKEDYFNKFITNPRIDNSTFCDVLRSGNVIELFNDLNQIFNGGIFKLENESEIAEIRNSNLKLIADALDGNVNLKGQASFWKFYDFNLLPIEFISRLYERFVVSTEENKQKATGAYYTPPHLARLLIDELIPFEKVIDFNNFSILDPSCGSGIFLVLAYKRLITIWMLIHKKQKVKGRVDILAIQNILTKCIYGIDINADALSITAISLQIELLSHIHPKEITHSLKFNNLEEKGNLTEIGFFKWYKQENKKFDIIVGNPPFNIGNDQNDTNIKIGKDENYKDETYIDYKNVQKPIPQKNPALSILNQSLTKLLKPEIGNLFMIMPAASLIYNSTSFEFRKNLFAKWDVIKIYDFTPLMNHLWGKVKIATIAIKISHSNTKPIHVEHIIVRNTIINEKGSIKFQIDKYDKYLVPIDTIMKKNFNWKINLFGGGYLEIYDNKYHSKEFTKISTYFKENGWKTSNGYRNDKASENKVNIKNKKILNTDEFKTDSINEEITYIESKNKEVRKINEFVATPPNILIRLNLNYSLPTVYNKLDLVFFPGVLAIKGPDNKEMKHFVKHFIDNRKFYETIITIRASKAFIQQSAAFSIDKSDILNLPLNLNTNNKIIPFEERDHIEKAIYEDVQLIIESLESSSASIFNKVHENDIEKFSIMFCEILNHTYKADNFEFKEVRRIITEEIIWVSYKHTCNNKSIEKKFNNNNKDVFSLLEDRYLNNGLIINRIITYYDEANTISFVKPNKLKFWTRSIACRDAENVKADMYQEGY